MPKSRKDNGREIPDGGDESASFKANDKIKTKTADSQRKKKSPAVKKRALKVPTEKEKSHFVEKKKAPVGKHPPSPLNKKHPPKKHPPKKHPPKKHPPKKHPPNAAPNSRDYDAWEGDDSSDSSASSDDSNSHQEALKKKPSRPVPKKAAKPEGVDDPPSKKRPPTKRPPKKHPPKKHPPKTVPNITDDDAWELDDSSDSNASSDDSNYKVPEQKSLKPVPKKAAKPEGMDDQRWADLQGEFLAYSNFRLLPGESVHKDEIVESFRGFEKAPLGVTASTAEIEALFMDWYERKIRLEDSKGVYQGIHLNPKYHVKKEDSSNSKKKPKSIKSVSSTFHKIKKDTCDSDSSSESEEDNDKSSKPIKNVLSSFRLHKTKKDDSSQSESEEENDTEATATRSMPMSNSNSNSRKDPPKSVEPKPKPKLKKKPAKSDKSKDGDKPKKKKKPKS